MKNIKTIFILVLSLILLFAVSCSNEDKTGEPETTETIEIDAKDFPENLKGTYRDENVASAGYTLDSQHTKVSTITELGIQKTKIEGTWLKDGATPPTGNGQGFSIEKWKQTKKGGNPIKLEGESSGSGGGKYTVIYDYASGTLIGTYTHPTDGTWSFNGKKIN